MYRNERTRCSVCRRISRVISGIGAASPVDSHHQAHRGLYPWCGPMYRNERTRCSVCRRISRVISGIGAASLESQRVSIDTVDRRSFLRAPLPTCCASRPLAVHLTPAATRHTIITMTLLGIVLRFGYFVSSSGSPSFGDCEPLVRKR